MKVPDAMMRSVSSRFSSAAETYERSSPAQGRMANVLARMIATLPPPARVLDAGCGTGRLTMLVRKAFPRARIDAIDIAPGAIALAQQRFAKDHAITCRTADAATASFPHRFRLVVSNSSFQWITPLDSLFANLKRSMTSSGTLMFAMMTQGTLKELREARLAVAPGKPPQADLPSVDEVISSLETAGFLVLKVKANAIRMQYASASAFLRGIHRAGVTGGSLSLAGSKRQTRQLGRSELAALMRYYDRKYRLGKRGVYATYEALYVTATPVFKNKSD